LRNNIFSPLRDSNLSPILLHRELHVTAVLDLRLGLSTTYCLKAAHDPPAPIITVTATPLPGRDTPDADIVPAMLCRGDEDMDTFHNTDR
jgi:hypothetical protein